MPAQMPPQAPVQPAQPPAQAESAAKAAGHEYRSAVDISALHALRGNSAYFDPMLHGHMGPAQVPSSGGFPICPSCGTNLEANARFCGECGYSLPERIPACAGCGVALEPGAKFCGECGTPVLQVPAASQPQVDAKGKGGNWMIKFLKFLEN
jgi:predicted amidophosphoribosyltransferase